MDITEYFNTTPSIPEPTQDSEAGLNESNLPTIGSIVLDTNEKYTDSSGIVYSQLVMVGQEYDILVYEELYNVLEYSRLGVMNSGIDEIPYRVIADDGIPPVGMVYHSTQDALYDQGFKVRTLLLADGSMVDEEEYPDLYEIMQTLPENTSPYGNFPDKIVAD